MIAADLRTIVRTRRDGGRHSPADLETLARAAASGEASDEILAAWLMAAYLRPLDETETAALTVAMANSGERLDLSSLPGPHLDKHSTGGVGDKTTIALLPTLAACGLTMVKMSGRGLGITGGTVDKLEAIPGVRTDLSPEEMIAQAGRIGIALSGQTPRLAPADGRLYALRDATETVDSIPLIAASILSKKIAGGAEAVLLDVKSGSGAFMSDAGRARELARTLERIGVRAGLRLKATITDMSQPLGRAVGNALEIREALDVLENRIEGGPTRRFADLVLAFAGEALHFAGLVPEEGAGRRAAEEAIRSGAARRKADEWLRAQGATVNPFARWEEEAPVRLDLAAERSGVLARLDARKVGEAALALGAGRLTKRDAVDPRVGIELSRAIGDPVAAGEPLAILHARTREDAEAAAARLRAGIEIAEAADPPPLFL